MKKCQIDITGMHCRSCEILVEDELKQIHGVISANVDHQKGTAEVYFKKHLYQDQIEKAILAAGYTLGKEKTKLVSTNIIDYQDLAIAGVIVAALYIVGDILGVFRLGINTSGNYASLPVVFLIGLTAGVSTCMALIGGLVLGAAAKFSVDHPQASNLEKFKPHLQFNAGRIISYFVLGGLIGLIGSVFQLSTSVLGILIVAVGMIMLVLGTQLIEVFPILKKVSFTLPKSVSRALGFKEQNPFLMGTMTFFLPCGFTQAMQLYAMSTGSPVKAALTMGVFALGTAPGLLGVGGLTSVVKGSTARIFFKTTGVVIMLLAFFNISNGLNLLGFNISSLTVATAKNTGLDPNVQMINGVQVVKMTQSGRGYSPNKFTIKKGVPVRWVINSVDAYTCASSIVVPQLGIRQGLRLGENILEFTPDSAGNIRFTCSMGMYAGVFNVI